MKKYPDISNLLELKEARRREISNLPISEKMKIAKHLQAIGRNAPGKNVRSKRDQRWTDLLLSSRPGKKAR